MIQKLAWLSIAGACGTLSRFALCEFAAKTGGPRHMATFAVNIIGCLLFGLVYGIAQSRTHLSKDAQAIILVGFMGAFTTFSALAFDTAKLMNSSQWVLAIGNVAGQIVFGVAAVAVGVIVGRLA